MTLTHTKKMEGTRKRQYAVDDVLLRACDVGTFEDVVNAVENGANVNAVTKNGVYALMIAIQHPTEAEEMVQFLIRRGVDCTVCTQRKNTALHYACKIPCVTVVRMLVDACPSLVHLNNEDEVSPLLVCCRVTHLDANAAEIASVLLQHNAEPGIAFYAACEYGTVELARAFLENRVARDNVDVTGALVHACRNRYAGVAIIPQLVAAGAVPNVTHAAEAYSAGADLFTCITKYLGKKLTSGGFTNATQDTSCPDPIGCLCAGAPFGAQLDDGCLANAIKDDTPAEYIWALIRARCYERNEVDICTHRIHEVMGDTDDVQLWRLVADEMMSMRHPTTGNTLLHVAASHNKQFAVDILLKRKVNPFLRNADKHTPVDTTTSTAIVAMLSEYSRFKPTHRHMVWRGPYFRMRVRAFLRVLVRWRNSKIRCIPRDVVTVILGHLSVLEGM